MWYYCFTTPSWPLVSWLPHVSTGLSLFLSTPTLLSDPRKEKMDVVQSMKVGSRVGEKKSCQANLEKWRKNYVFLRIGLARTNWSTDSGFISLNLHMRFNPRFIMFTWLFLADSFWSCVAIINPSIFSFSPPLFSYRLVLQYVQQHI